ncbi:hypothetical protein KC734_11340 [candidate division KSB1 bacterium]|nr:hypothetical protein [candidate division KSB1 bacterium]
MKHTYFKIGAALAVSTVFLGWALHVPHATTMASGHSGTAELTWQVALADSVPAMIVSPSCIGEVQFPHKYHYEEMEIDCKDCHHETNATTIETPHDEYFQDFWIDCAICHRKNGNPVMEAQSCSSCHHSTPSSVADETLSAKVVIHKNCWDCHGVGTGQEASESCAFCHSGERSEHR